MKGEWLSNRMHASTNIKNKIDFELSIFFFISGLKYLL
jgi:hypothetical protein